MRTIFHCKCDYCGGWTEEIGEGELAPGRVEHGTLGIKGSGEVMRFICPRCLVKVFDKVLKDEQ